MRCIVFIDTQPMNAQTQYNKWAENQTLAKDVIIHSHVIPPSVGSYGRLVIVVFFDERIHPTWHSVSSLEEGIT